MKESENKMKNNLPFMTESGNDFQSTVTIGSFNNTRMNSFDDNFDEVAKEFRAANININEDAHQIVKSDELYENYRDMLVRPLMEECSGYSWEDHGNLAGLGDQVTAMMDNRRDLLLKESVAIGQLLPIKMVDFPLIVKDHLKNVIKDIMQCEVTKSPIVKKQIQHTWIVDKQTKKRYEYPQCLSLIHI